MVLLAALVLLLLLAADFGGARAPLPLMRMLTALARCSKVIALARLSGLTLAIMRETAGSSSACSGESDCESLRSTTSSSSSVPPGVCLSGSSGTARVKGTGAGAGKGLCGRDRCGARAPMAAAPVVPGVPILGLWRRLPDRDRRRLRPLSRSPTGTNGQGGGNGGGMGVMFAAGVAALFDLARTSRGGRGRFVDFAAVG